MSGKIVKNISDSAPEGGFTEEELNEFIQTARTMYIVPIVHYLRYLAETHLTVEQAASVVDLLDKINLPLDKDKKLFTGYQRTSFKERSDLHMCFQASIIPPNFGLSIFIPHELSNERRRLALNDINRQLFMLSKQLQTFYKHFILSEGREVYTLMQELMPSYKLHEFKPPHPGLYSSYFKPDEKKWLSIIIYYRNDRDEILIPGNDECDKLADEAQKPTSVEEA